MLANGMTIETIRAVTDAATGTITKHFIPCYETVSFNSLFKTVGRNRDGHPGSGTVNF
jgi:hypothetical protein